LTSDACGQLCDQTRLRLCCSYEWSPTSKICNLNQQCEPSAPKYQDYTFCKIDTSASITCRTGYVAASGDVPQFGNIGANSINNILTSDACGKLCDQTSGCCSYEWSPTSKICNLNRECQPSAPKYQDYGFCKKEAITCSTGYVAASGDVPGMGNIGANSTNNILTSDACGQLCDQTRLRLCCSYEWSPTSKICNLNQQCEPSAPKYQDYTFCKIDTSASITCRTGYVAASGDVPQFGNIGANSINNILTSDACGKLCDQTSGCCSYEWSPTSKICNLNRECQPSAPKYQDYGFCKKEDTMDSNRLLNKPLR